MLYIEYIGIFVTCLLTKFHMSATINGSFAIAENLSLNVDFM